MRVGFPGGARLEWYDRNPDPKADHFSSGDLAPHVETTRVSYTVPTGKKALLESLIARVLRSAAATTAGRVASSWLFTRLGGSAKVLLSAEILTNLVGDKDALAIGATLTMLTGDALEGLTGDVSSGGTVKYLEAYKLTEFSA